MTSKEGFGLGIRITGLIVFLYGADWILRFALGQLGFFKLERTDIVYYLIIGIVYLSVGAYFLSGAPMFVKYFYRNDDLDNEEDNSDAENKSTKKETDVS